MLACAKIARVARATLVARPSLVAGVLVGAALVGSCEPYPRDPRSTYERARGGVLRVGVADAPPWVLRRGTEVTGIEPALIREFAASLDARVEWSWAPQEEQLRKLERFELDLVAAGLTRSTPWKDRVGLTVPYRGEGEHGRVLAAPPGENRFLVELERFLLAR